MAKFQYIIQGFGLQKIRPHIYGKLTEEQLKELALETGGSDFGDADDVEIDISDRMNGGADDQMVLSVLGTPVWADLEISSEDGTHLLMDMVLIEVNQAKNIVTTAIQGRKGTVKEYINDGDFNVRIRGALVSQKAHTYPKEDVSRLIALMKTPESLAVVSPYLQQFEIYNIVVTDFNFPQQEGYQNMQLFEINAISDTPIELVEDV